MKKRWMVLIAMFLFLFNIGNVSATVIVDFEVVMLNGNGVWGTGTFSGDDLDSNGYLEFNELSFFDGSNNIQNATINLATLYDTGDFELATDTWLNNAVSWPQSPDIAWFTWNSRASSVGVTWASVTVTAVRVDQPVPEPATLILFSMGLLGLAGVSRRKK